MSVLQCLSANQKGDLILKIKSELASVNVSFKDLLQANWSMYTSYVCFVLLVLYATPDSLGLDDWGAWHRCLRSDSIVEWRNFVRAKNFTGRRWDSNPGPCR